jgi:hypothetical protein
MKLNGKRGQVAKDEKMTRRLELDIEELVLHGFAGADRRRIGDALQAELERQFTAQELPSFGDKSISIARLSCAAFTCAAGATSSNIGADLAHSLHRGLSRSVASKPGAVASSLHRGARTR